MRSWTVRAGNQIIHKRSVNSDGLSRDAREPERQMTAIDGHSWVKQIDKLSRPIRRAKSKQKPEKARFCDWRLHLNIYIAPYLVQ